MYANTLHNPFVFDDVLTIERNPNLRRLWPPGAALGAPPGTGASGRPVVALSLAVNYAVCGLEPPGWHVFNIGAHVLTAWVLFLLVRGTLATAPLRARFGARADVLAGAVALLWVVHPLHTGAVDHVTYRNEILASLFYLCGLECLRRTAAAQQAGRRGAARRAGGAAVLAGALAMGSKEMAVSAPLAALLYDRLFLAETWRELWRRRGAVHVGLAAGWLVLAACVAAGDRGASVGMGFADVTPGAYAVTSLAVVTHYLRLAFWPHPLVIDYAWPVRADLGPVLGSIAVVAVLLAATLVACWRAPRLAFPALVFVAVLAPTSSFIPLAGAVAAEHRMYLPLAGLVLLVVLAADGLGRRAGPWAPRLALLGGAVAVLALAGATWRRNLDYASAETLWSRTVAQRPDNARAHGNLGTAQLHAGKLAAAAASYARMAQLDPRNPAAHANWGMALLRQGRLEEAQARLLAARGLAPRDAQVRYDLGLLHRARHEVQAAAAAWDSALQLDPTHLAARHDLALARLELGDTAAAQQHLRRYLGAMPDDVAALNNLGWTLATAPQAELRSGPEALRCADRAARLVQHRDPEILDTLAAALAESGRFAAAESTAVAAGALATAAGRADLAAQLAARARLYGAGRPYRAAR